MKRLLFLPLFLASLAFADLPIYISGSGVKPDATNAVLETAIAYTDSATNSVISSLLTEIAHSVAVSEDYTDAATNAVVEAFIARDTTHWADNSRLVADGNYIPSGNETRYTLASNVVEFEMTDIGVYDVAVEVYTEVGNHIYTAVCDETVGQKWGVLFTTDQFGVSMDFNLYITITPKSSISTRDCKTVAYKLRRTF